jgi:hypothetical protein
VVADIVKLSVGREAYYTRELASDHEQYFSGHGESPGRWYGAAATLGLEGEASGGGFRPCSMAATPPPASCWGAPMAATRCPASMWSCGRPRACRSSTAWVTRPPDGRSSRPITRGWPRRSGTWTSMWAPAVAMSGSTTGRPERATRWCTPTWSSPTGSRGRTAAGRRWTAGACIGIGSLRTPSTGPPTSASSSGHWAWSGHRRTPMATASWPGCPRRWSGASPSAPARSMPSWVV